MVIFDSIKVMIFDIVLNINPIKNQFHKKVKLKFEKISKTVYACKNIVPTETPDECDICRGRATSLYI